MGLGFIMFQLSGIEFLVSMVLSGACERNPDFQFVLGECGIGWIPYVIERTDSKYDDRLFHLGFNMKPSEYWQRQGYSTFQQEYVSTDEIERIGINNIMWGSDYPHPDGVFPDSAKAIAEGMGHLDDAVRQKLICENAARVYRFN
jgi:predicted TIM-barrel fold metal-dependent hydrolase